MQKFWIILFAEKGTESWRNLDSTPELVKSFDGLLPKGSEKRLWQLSSGEFFHNVSNLLNFSQGVCWACHGLFRETGAMTSVWITVLIEHKHLSYKRAGNEFTASVKRLNVGRQIIWLFKLRCSLKSLNNRSISYFDLRFVAICKSEYSCEQ